MSGVFVVIELLQDKDGLFDIQIVTKDLKKVI